MKVLVCAFNQEKTQVEAFSVIVKTDGSFAALVFTLLIITHCTESQLDPATTRHQAAAASILSFG